MGYCFLPDNQGSQNERSAIMSHCHCMYKFLYHYYATSTGCVSAMLLNGGLSSLGKRKGGGGAAQPLKSPLPVIKPFKKQLHSAQKLSEDAGKSQSSVAMPIQLSGMDPVSELCLVHRSLLFILFLFHCSCVIYVSCLYAS